MGKTTSIVDELAAASGLSAAKTRKLFEALGTTIGRRLVEGERVPLVELGQFSLASYEARRVPDMHHPGKMLAVPAHHSPDFSMSESLRSQLRGVEPRATKVALTQVAHPVAVDFIDLANQTIPKTVLEILPERVMRRYDIVPFEVTDTTLKLAMTDPENHEAIELVKKATGKQVTPYLTTHTDIARLLDRGESSASEITELANEAAEDVHALPEKSEAAESSDVGLEHAPAAKLVSNLLKRAVREGASDIHIEPAEVTTRVRFRVDGVLREVVTLPRSIHNGLVARIKVLTNLRLDERRLPQDGRFRTLIDHGEIDFRVSLLPTVDGEKVVMRILDKSAGVLSLEQVGMRGQQFDIFEGEIHKPHGMILVTGPTGSGKTTTLYAAIERLRSPKTNITTLEDPVEYRMPGVNQSQVQSDIGFTFAAGLRSILRQDPNVVLVGEIRDQETAEIAVNAALTGHIVLSTLHTNDAAGAIPRLIDMGIEPFLITSSLNAVLAQRLVRRICEKCRVPSNDGLIAPEVKAELHILQKHPRLLEGLDFDKKKLASPRFMKGKGCPHCGNTGFKGRFGIYEILPANDTLKPLIASRTDGSKLGHAAIEMGMLTMRQDGVLKALDGLTTIEEVWRVTKV